jgi:benzoylformate decarboxylase
MEANELATMTGAQAFYEMLVRQGVEYIFGNPGTSELPLMDVFAERTEIEYILALHEDSALGVAAGYAEASGKPAVVNLHTNPGLAHALGNLYNAYRAGTPMIVTAGQQDTRSLIGEPLLQADMVEMARQHTKWAWEVKAAAEIPFALSRAFTLATSAPTAPVFLSLPVNVMEESAAIEFPQVTRIGQRLRGERAQIEAAAKLLAEAQQPVIIAGDGCARSGGVPELVKLAERIGAKVHTEVLHSLLDFPTGHHLFAGPLSPAAQAAQGQLAGADVILTAGAYTLAPLVYTGARMIPESAKLIQIDANERELGKNYPADVAILADPRTAVEEINGALQAILTDEMAERIQRRSKIIGGMIADGRAKFAAQVLQPKADDMISPAHLAHEMRQAAAKDAIIVDEAVTSTAYVRTLFQLNEPDSYYFAKGGSLGYGLPLAVGVKMARRERQVICTIGDGSALYSPQALWTAARYNLGVVFVIFNNTSYLILKGGLLAMKGKSVERNIYTGMDISEPYIDFVKMAESMGVAAKRVTQLSELRTALDWALQESASQSKPHLLDVLVSSELRSMLR